MPAIPDPEPAWRDATLSLGGNIGDSVQLFLQAIGSLDENPQINVREKSSVWRTSPWGKHDQPDFFNMALQVRTSLGPLQLLAVCQAIENTAGRIRGERWGPRTLDIDLITFADVELRTPALTLPHPRAHQRAFVLAPLAEIAPDLMLHRRTMAQWLTLVAEDGDQNGAAESFMLDSNATARLSAG